MTAFIVLAETEDGEIDNLLLTKDGEQANLKFRELLQTSDEHTFSEVWLINTRTHLRHRRFRRAPSMTPHATKKPSRKTKARKTRSEVKAGTIAQSQGTPELKGEKDVTG